MKRRDRRLPILEFLLKNVVALEDQENLTGDFAEMFDRISRDRGKIAAAAWYALQVIKLLPSYFRDYVFWSVFMIMNYLKVAFRNIRKYKAYSFINILGLAIGIACCLLIVLFVRDELGFDRYHEKADRIFRLVDGFDLDGPTAREYALSSAPFAPALKREFPEVEDAVRLFPGRRRLVAYGDKKHYEDGLFFVDASLFNVFTFPFLEGDPGTALETPNSVVLSRSAAAKYFGVEPPLGKTLRINDQDFRVTGLMRDIPANSHFRADLFASLKTIERIPGIQERYLQNWVRHEFYTYLLLREGARAADLQAALPGFVERHAAGAVRTVLGSTLSSRLQPLTGIHLRSRLQLEIGPNGDILYVSIFSVVALFILLIACINFVNLATARSANRAKEVGLRKVVGASRSQIAQHFLGESLVFTLAAMALALIFVLAALPSFNALTGKSLSAGFLKDNVFWGALLLILVLAGVASGSYPALYISRFQPTGIFRKVASSASGRSRLRKILVIFQFGVSIVLLVSTAVVRDQLDFLRNRKLGFDKDHVVVIPIRDHSLRLNSEAVKAELLRNPAVISATITIGVPGGNLAGDAVQLLTADGEKTVSVSMIYTDHDYLKTMGMEVLLGRDFSKEMATDASQAFIINEAAVRMLALADPLATRLKWDDKNGRVIGVVRDFQFQSLRDEIDPLFIQIWPLNTFVFAIRVRPAGIRETLAFIEDTWKRLDPAHPFEYSFLDETFDNLYKGEEKLGRIIGIFSGLAVFIAVLGLLGLAMFIAQQRTREIGVRKVLGASEGNIFILLSREFAALVMAASLVAWPAAYFLMRKWLQGFAYRVDLEPWVFLLSAGAALAAALLTTSFQAVQAARTDPVKALRHE